MKISERFRLYGNSLWVFIIGILYCTFINILTSTAMGGLISFLISIIAYIIVGTFTAAFVKSFFIFGGSLLLLEMILSSVALFKNLSKFISIVEVRCLDKSYKEVMSEIASDPTFWKRVREDRI